MVDFKQIDHAYIQYMTSCDILVHLIPRHRDFPSMSNGSREWYRSYLSTRRVSSGLSHRQLKMSDILPTLLILLPA